MTQAAVESPENFILQPMLINTNFPASLDRRRGTHSRRYAPRESLSPPGANYSGLLECPCTTRTKKVITGFQAKSSGTCGEEVLGTPSECFSAAAQLIGGITKNASISDATFPRGCFLLATSCGTEAHFNSASSSAQCGAKAGVPIRSMGSAAFSSDSQVQLHLDLDQATKNATITIAGPADVWFAVGFNAANMADAPYTIVVDGEGVVSERKLGNHMPGTQLASTVDVISNTDSPASEVPPVKLNHAGKPLADDTPSSDRRLARRMSNNAMFCLTLTLNFTTPYNLADGACTLRSSSSLGFTSSGWIDGMYSGEKRLGASNVRTVILRRALVGASASYFTFDPTRGSLPFIAAYGQSATFSYHGPKSRGGETVTMVEVGAPICVCKGKNGRVMASFPGLQLPKLSRNDHQKG